MPDRFALPPDFVPTRADIAGAAVYARRVADEAGLARDFCSRASCRRNGRCVGPPGGFMLLPCLDRLRREASGEDARERQAKAERAEMEATLEKILGGLMASSRDEERAAPAEAARAADAPDAADPPWSPAPEDPKRIAPERDAEREPSTRRTRDAPAVRSLDERAFPWLRAYRPRGLSG